MRYNITMILVKILLLLPVTLPISILPKEMLIVYIEYTRKGSHLFISSLSKEFNKCFVKAYSNYKTNLKALL